MNVVPVSPKRLAAIERAAEHVMGGGTWREAVEFFKEADETPAGRTMVAKSLSGQELTLTEATELEDLAITGAAGVRRGANRAQFGADGWLVMKKDGTPIEKSRPLARSERTGDPMPTITTPPAPARAPITKALVFSTIEKLADEMRSARPELTKEAAIGAVVDATPALKDLYRAAPEAAAVVEPQPVFRGAIAFGQLEQIARDLRARHLDMSEAQAITKASELRPDLVEAYRNER